MATIDLSKYGITGTTEIIRNPSYEFLFEEETKAGLEGYDRGQVTDLGAVNVMTGIYTGRSPKDKFIVMDDTSRDTVWWTSDEFKNDNKPASQEAWDACKKLAQEQLSNKRLFVMDVFCGANHDSRMAIRFIMEVAWQAHFVKNMFIQPTAEELENFEPDFISYNAAKAKVLYDYLDGQDFYKNRVEKKYRSMMNVTFTSPDADTDKAFCAAATEAGFVNLKGHRLVGGMRASIYNAMPAEGIDKLVGFMEKFRREH